MDVPLRFNPTFTSAAPVVKFGRTLEEKRVQKRHRGGCASPASLSEAREKVVTPDWCSIYTTLKRLHPPRSQESHPGDLVGTRAWWTGSGGVTGLVLVGVTGLVLGGCVLEVLLVM